MTSRILSARTGVLIAAAIVMAGAVLLASMRPVSAESSTTPGSRIVAVAMQSLHQQEGQCFPWVRRVVEAATGNQIGWGYRDGYLSGGALEVPYDSAQPGDIVQIADDADAGPGASYPGLHTAIVMQRHADGLLTVIDSNSQWDGIVRIREDYDPHAAAARYPNLSVRVYRFETGLPSSTIPAAHQSSPETTGETQAQTLTPGGQARVTGGGCTNLRFAAGLGAGVIRCVPDGSIVEVLPGSTSAGGYQWQEVRIGTDVGWMATDFLQALSSSGPPPASTPPPSSTPSPGAGSSGTLVGSLPTGGGPGLVQWSGGPMESLLVSALDGGCSVLSAWVTVDGEFVGYTNGAPAFVNAQWRTLYPGDLPSQAMILICGGSASGAPPAASAPPPGTGSSPSAPQAGAPPGPAGNED